MEGSWREGTVSELQAEGILLVEDGNHGESRPRREEFTSEGVAFIRAADMDNGTVHFGAASKISETARRRITKGIGAPGDVLLSHKGTVGKVALVPSDAPSYVCSPQTTLWRSRNLEALDRRYLYAFLRSPSFRAQLASRSGETDMAPYVSLTAQRTLIVNLPPIEHQRAIGNILGTLDDKIELNRRTNETLEAMARALFKSWFVDFDPVRAKAAGKQPAGMDTETAALFPSELVESEIGEVPKGWRPSTVADACDLNPTRPLPRGTIAPYVEMASLPTTGHRPSKWPGREVGSGARFKNGDTLLARITPCLENGKTGYVDFLEDDGIGWGSTEYIVIRPKPPLPTEWGYLLAREPAFRDFATQKMEGTTGRQRVPAAAVGKFTVVVPPATICERFASFVSPAFGRMATTSSESSCLAATRDALLPRLLSGELRIPDAERIVGAAT